MAKIEPWIAKNHRHQFRAEIFKLLDSVGLENALVESRVLQATLDEKREKGKAPYFEVIERDVRMRLMRGDIDAAEAQDILDQTRQTIVTANRAGEQNRLIISELERKAHDAFIREARQLEPVLKAKWEELYAKDRRLKAALPRDVHDDSSAIKAGEQAVKNWVRRCKIYPRLSTIWLIGTELRQVSVFESYTKHGFDPADYMYRYSDRLVGRNSYTPKPRTIAEKLWAFDKNIERGAEPGFYTVADIRVWEKEEREAEREAAAARRNGSTNGRSAKPRPVVQFLR